MFGPHSRRRLLPLAFVAGMTLSSMANAIYYTSTRTPRDAAKLPDWKQMIDQSFLPADLTRINFT